MFKYVDETGAVGMVRDRLLKWTRPNQLGDPLEMSWQRFGVPPDELTLPLVERFLREAVESPWEPEFAVIGPMCQAIRAIREHPESAEEEIQLILDAFSDRDSQADDPFLAHMRKRIAHTKICCVSSTPADPVMWSNYAARGTGVAVGLHHAMDMGTARVYPKRIRYVEDRDSMTAVRPTEWARHLLDLQVLNGEEGLDRAMYTKPSRFSYEEEWRYIIRDHVDTPHKFLPLRRGQIRSIVLGVNTAPDLENRLHDAVAGCPDEITLYRAVPTIDHPNAYRIVEA